MFVGKNPWMSQSFPRARVVLQRDREGPGAVDDRDRPGAHRHRQAGRLPPARAARHRRLVPGRAGGDAGPGGPLSTRRSWPSTCTGAEPVLAALARGAGRRLRRALRRRRGADPRRRPAHRPARRASSVFEDLGVQQAPNSTLCSYLNKLLWMLTGNFAKPGGQHLHSSFVPLFRPGARRPHAGHRRADHRRPGAVQRDRRRRSSPTTRTGSAR